MIYKSCFSYGPKTVPTRSRIMDSVHVVGTFCVCGTLWFT